MTRDILEKRKIKDRCGSGKKFEKDCTADVFVFFENDTTGSEESVLQSEETKKMKKKY